MAQENVEIVRAVYERYRQGDFRASGPLLDAHAVLVLDNANDWGLDSSMQGVFVGPPAIADYTRGLLEPWTGFTMEARELTAAGDSVLVSVHQSGVGRTSGVPAELRYFTLWSFRGPKVIRIESFRDRSDALKAAGLSE